MTGLELAESLKRFRKNNKMSQEEMAREMGVSRTMYQAYEGGKSAPSILVLVNFADSQKVSLDYLLGRASNPLPLNSKIEVQEEKDSDEPVDEIESLKERLAKLEDTVAKLAS